jgi:hypothetical protein
MERDNMVQSVPDTFITAQIKAIINLISLHLGETEAEMYLGVCTRSHS